MQGNYKEFSHIYDILTYDVDYQGYYRFLKENFKKNSISPELILDLACGTGTMSKLLADGGYDVIAIDSSLDMLDLAKNKCENNNVLFLNQNMTEFELYGTVDVIACLLDSLNYLQTKTELKKVFKLAYNYLNYNGLFIFDLNSPYKLKNILGNNTFVYEYENVFYTWENKTESDFTSFYLNFFVKNSKNSFERIEEIHTQRAYDLNYVKSLLLKSGFKYVDVYGGFDFKKPTKTTERLLFVAVK